MSMFRAVLITLITCLSISCGGESKEETVLKAVAFESADECHLCGMIIEGFAGPKGAATSKTDTHVRKFCSTRDLFSYYLDPENKRNVKTLLVHDMGTVPWETPDDELMINAEAAWYVVGSSQKGAMGSTLATFGDKGIAQTFAEQFGGEVLSFEQITFDHIAASHDHH
ncbi:nitrous oxide reductase accessory protein NosL [Thalassotalea sp. M1531]|uniref:Nitrous oxide reductase accessory protein NosL n=1 Tax=Thalassotalea algicola TaxID=2716224 RepID=A0A7Y0LCL4_9GAMM|nr:nitrous oxide reductase accessory protein NosL [Thalassotalea algicola]NMP31647.1 nitrous oxide reductase accessory protein NosL [Thalassotalea algicola]